jgi:hypothetical protein
MKFYAINRNSPDELWNGRARAARAKRNKLLRLSPFVAPEILEARWRKFGIAHGMLAAFKMRDRKTSSGRNSFDRVRSRRRQAIEPDAEKGEQRRGKIGGRLDRDDVERNSAFPSDPL